MGPQDPRLLMLMQGVPQPIAAPPIPQPQTMGVQPMPYRETGLTSVLNGLNKFIGAYRQESEAKKAKAAQQVDRDLKLVSMGIPIDQKSILKNMKTAGIELQLDQDSRPVQGPQQPGPSMEMAGGYMGMQPQQVQMTGPPIPAAQAPQPGIWDKMKSAIGLGQQPNYGPNSPAAQWLNQYSQLGQQRMQMAGKQTENELLSLDNAASKEKLIRGVLAGDPKSIEMGTHLGLWQRTPLEEMQAVGRKVGISEEEIGATWLANVLGTRQFKAQMMDMATKLADRFNGKVDVAAQYVRDIFESGASKLTPGRTFDESMKVAKAANDLQMQYINMPLNVATTYAEAMASGNNEVVQQIGKALAAVDPKTGMPLNPTKAQFEAMAKLRELGQGDTRLAQGAQGLQNEQQRIKQTWAIHYDNFRINAGMALSNSIGRQWDDWYRIYTDKDATKSQKNQAVEQMANLATQLNDIQIPTGLKDQNGQDVTVRLSPSKLKATDIEHWLNWPYVMLGGTLPKELTEVFDPNASAGKGPTPKKTTSDYWVQAGKDILNAITKYGVPIF